MSMMPSGMWENCERVGLRSVCLKHEGGVEGNGFREPPLGAWILSGWGEGEGWVRWG